jgi:hypothetical protein
MLVEALAIVERGGNPLPHVEAFATSGVSEAWFALV